MVKMLTLAFKSIIENELIIFRGKKSWSKMDKGFGDGDWSWFVNFWLLYKFYETD